MNVLYGWTRRQLRRVSQESWRSHTDPCDGDFTEPSVEITPAGEPDGSGSGFLRRRKARTNRSSQAAAAATTAVQRKSFLFEMCRRWAWEVVVLRCRTHPHELDETVVDANGDTALHLALIGNPPSDAIDALLTVCPQLAATRNHKRDYPLHTAASYRCSSDVVRRIVRAYPEAAGLPDGRGSYPLHLLCDYGCTPDSVRAVLECEPGRRSVHAEDRIFIRTPLQILHQQQNMPAFHSTLTRLRSMRQKQQKLRSLIVPMHDSSDPIYIATNRQNQQLNQDCMNVIVQLERNILDLEHLKYWKIAKALIMANTVQTNASASSPPPPQSSHLGSEQQQQHHQQQQPEELGTTMIFECLRTAYCPSSFLEFAMLLRLPELEQRHPETADLPIHLALSLESLPPDVVSTMVRICPRVAQIGSGRGKLPLQLALDRIRRSPEQMARQWDRAIFELFLANPNAIHAVDVDQRLTPFLWAKLKHHPDVLYACIVGSPHLFDLQNTTRSTSQKGGNGTDR